MITAILIDLDNTLLGNDMETFLPLYLQKLGAHLADLIPPNQMIPELMTGTRKMMDNLDPTVSLEQAFAQHFYPALGVSEGKLRDMIIDFYATVFPSIQAITTRYPDIDRFMKAIFETGYEVVIATSPVFPRTAILQRLEWAGVPVDQFNYTFITSYEDFHFTKPHLEYYAEILGRLGKPSHEAVMIGNDPEDDLEPAQALGMAVFHAHPSSPDEYPGGSLADVLPWLEGLAEHSNDPYPSRPEVLLARHRGNLAALLSMTKNLNDPIWTHRVEMDEWAPVEIVCHLRDVEAEVNLPRVRTILNDLDPHISSFDTDLWAEERDYICQSGPNALTAFIEERQETISILEEIDAEDWSRPARHSLFGPTTLLEVMNIAAEHDLIHLAQLRSALADGES
ncbi:MAG: DinB family protein [Anaerolineaceae bacterium]|nr:MAG: DinB family protein [Anaerolineaceae bacterium]